MLPWVKALHLVGMVLWLGGIIYSALLLSRLSQEKPEVQHALAPSLRALRAGGLWVGAFLVLLTGIATLVTNMSYFKMGWFHAKLTLVFVLLGAHGLLEKKIARALRGPVVGDGKDYLRIYMVAAFVLVTIVTLTQAMPF